MYPDLTVASELDRPEFVIDAKYKTNSEKGRVRISEADAYEALAFAQATGCNTVILAYPAPPAEIQQPVGYTSLFERVDIGGTKIYGLQLEVRGISRRSGLKTFSNGLRGGLTSLLQP